ncbi:hypothetical protein DXG01_013977 [Tephrocybe rancida]|nr:hypothetical protein DXG01_013977 [Tephrocybe rancida]
MDAPRCFGMQELPEAVSERLKVSELLASGSIHTSSSANTPLFAHLSHGLAYTVGSALGSTPPTTEMCLSAFLVLNKAGLTVGARAWSKHSHRSQPSPGSEASARRETSSGWWGSPSGPVSVINERAIALFWKVMNSATWRNLHWLPHQVLVYEARVLEGYGMRWSLDEKNHTESDADTEKERLWAFRGFLEPQMKNGHEIGWRH